MLGIALHEGKSFPVGKVDFLKLYPLSFSEFLMAMGRERFADLLDKQDSQLIASFKQTYIDALKQYYFVGGMPEAVRHFAENQNFNAVREIQKKILAAHEVVDIGLLGCMTGLRQGILLDGNDLFTESREPSRSSMFVRNSRRWTIWGGIITPMTETPVRLILLLIQANKSSLLRSRQKSI